MKLKFLMQVVDKELLFGILYQCSSIERGKYRFVSSNGRTIYSSGTPEVNIFDNRLYLNGTNTPKDNKLVKAEYETHEETLQAKEQFLRAIEEAFSVEKEPERGDLVPWKNGGNRIFLAEIKGAKSPYVYVSYGYEENFRNGEKFDTFSWRFIEKPKSKLTEVAPNIYQI